MLRIEIEDLMTQLFNQEKSKRSEARSRLLSLEKEGEIVIEILQPHLEDDNLVTKSYAIGAIFRIAFKNKFQKIEETFLKEQNIMYLPSKAKPPVIPPSPIIATVLPFVFCNP